MSELKRQMQICTNGLWKDVHHTTAAEWPPELVRFAEPMRPEMPDPKNTFADHSYPAYSRAQMVQAMLDAVELYRRTQPEATKPAQADERCPIVHGGSVEVAHLIAIAKATGLFGMASITDIKNYSIALLNEFAVPPAQDLSAAILRLQFEDSESDYKDGYNRAIRAAAALASPVGAPVTGDSETTKDTERLDFVLENGVPMMRNGEYRFHGFPGKWFKTDREAIDFAIQAQKDGHG